MAIWQFGFYVQPIDGTISDVSNDLLLYLRNKLSWLSEYKSWSSKQLQFGELDKTCISLFYSTELLQEISIRIDLRFINKERYNDICVMLNDLKLIVKLEDGNIMKFDDASFIKAVKGSNAAKFVVDPKKFIEQLENA